MQTDASITPIINKPLPPQPQSKKTSPPKKITPQKVRLMTFEDIDKMSPTKINKGFKPSDILDQLSDGENSEDEILKKY